MLEVEFHGGGVYQYFEVPQTVVEELLAQDSLGAYFNTKIRDSYTCARVR
jgi:KTSC domain